MLNNHLIKNIQDNLQLILIKKSAICLFYKNKLIFRQQVLSSVNKNIDNITYTFLYVYFILVRFGFDHVVFLKKKK